MKNEVGLCIQLVALIQYYYLNKFVDKDLIDWLVLNTLQAHIYLVVLV